MSPFIGCIVFQHLTSYWLICVINLNNLPLTSWLLYHHLTSYWQIVESTSCWLVYQHLTFQWFTSVLTSCLLLVDYCINISPLIGFQFLPLIGCSSNNAHIARLQLKLSLEIGLNKGTVSLYFRFFFWLKRFDLGSIWTSKNCFTTFFVFTEIFDRKVRKLGVSVVHSYAATRVFFR